MIATGTKLTDAYIFVGYSAKGAPQSASNLLKRPAVRVRVDEILRAAAGSTVAEMAFGRQQYRNRLDALSHKAESLGQISAAVRCEELIGKHLGMFNDLKVANVTTSSEPSRAEEIRMRRAKREEREAKAAADSPPLEGLKRIA